MSIVEIATFLVYFLTPMGGFLGSFMVSTICCGWNWKKAQFDFQILEIKSGKKSKKIFLLPGPLQREFPGEIPPTGARISIFYQLSSGQVDQHPQRWGTNPVVACNI